MALIGVAIGLAGSLMLTRLIENLSFEVIHVDATTLISVSTLLIIVSLLASYIPARRATRVELSNHWWYSETNSLDHGVLTVQGVVAM